MRRSSTLGRASSRPNQAAELDSVARWDVNAPHRLAELGLNDDPAYRGLTSIITRYVQRHAATREGRPLSILDVGCGLGFLARSLGSLGHSVVGIDPSEVSIKLARDASGRDPGPVVFRQVSLEAYARKVRRRFDIVVANMTLHCVAELPSFIDAAASVMTDDGVMLATVPNPSSYLQRREDINISGIDFAREQILEIPFRIHDHAPHPADVIFFHRPLRTYAAAIRGAGLKVSEYHIPDQVGNGKPRDVALFVLHHAAQGVS
jgi:2-polyprenyl-3-methyl-5-hydroxy-6-metoxy-1,4-benzoquinol methylase